MTKGFLLPMLLLASVFTFGQCDSLVTDEAGIIHDQAAIARAAQPLIDQGADVKVVTIAHMSIYGSALRSAFIDYVGKCDSWRAGNGAKANLVVFMVAPTEHKKNIFYGPAYMPVFPSEDSVNTLYSQAANPYFRTQQWEQGFAVTMKDFNAKIAAYHDQQKHPVQQTTTINQEATDYSGFWTFLLWLLGIGTAFGIGVWIVVAARRRKADEEEVATAQAIALRERDAASDAFARFPTTHERYADIAAIYQRLSDTELYDPSTPGISASDYRVATNAWNDLRKQIRDALYGKTVQTSSGPVRSEPVAGVSQEQPKTVHHHHTTIVRDDGNGFTAGLVMGEMLERDREPESERRRYRESDPEPASSGSDSSWSSPSSDSGGGSDSSWSSSDSGSSFGGGSDSSF